MSDVDVDYSSRCVTSASINNVRETITHRKTKSMFIITVQRKDNTSYEITKEYKDFFDLQCSILDTFPLEAGKSGYERIIPYLPGRKIFRRENLQLAQERKPDLNIYLDKLLKMTTNISQCKLLLDFFSKEQGDEQMDNIDLVQSTKEVSESVADATQCYVNTSYNPDCDEQTNTGNSQKL